MADDLGICSQGSGCVAWTVGVQSASCLLVSFTTIGRFAGIAGEIGQLPRRRGCRWSRGRRVGSMVYENA